MAHLCGPEAMALSIDVVAAAKEMKRVRYTMPARSHGKLYMQREMARLERDDVHRWVFVNSIDPDVETLVRKWLVQRLDNCYLQVMYIPHFTGPTHVVLNNAPPLHTMARTDEAVDVDNMEGGAM